LEPFSSRSKSWLFGHGSRDDGVTKPLECPILDDNLLFRARGRNVEFVDTMNECQILVFVRGSFAAAPLRHSILNQNPGIGEYRNKTSPQKFVERCSSTPGHCRYGPFTGRHQSANVI
jgi:hypothetical protein